MSLSKAVKSPSVEREPRLFLEKRIYLNTDGAQYLTTGICPRRLTSINVCLCNRDEDNYISLDGDAFEPFVDCLKHCLADKPYTWNTRLACGFRVDHEISVTALNSQNILVSCRGASVSLPRLACSRIVQNGAVISRDIRVYYPRFECNMIINTFESRVRDLDVPGTLSFLRSSITKRKPGGNVYTVLMDLLYNFDYLMTMRQYSNRFFAAGDTDTDSDSVSDSFSASSSDEN